MSDSAGWFERAPHSVAVLERSAIAREVAASLVALIDDVLARRSHATIVPSAGRTHLETFAILRDHYGQAVDWRRVVCVQMDEYADVGCADEGSLSAQVERELVAPLKIGRFIRFHDAHGQLRRPLRGYGQEIDALGGIDCAIHGVGVNAHIGFNEPGTLSDENALRVELAGSTRDANGVRFTQGVTLGVAALVAARTSIVVLLGAEKRFAAGELLHGGIGVHNPVGYLRHCDRVAIYMDPLAVPVGWPRAGGVWPNNVG
ncbi:MAG TPA: 6-phosphogluconolactonase [Steroidobacteraceae bacterium]|jgi:glucosamine-6-phosphate deaminase|nr:6-phosphogluconolactonase [Steroidobacteraceae bacterium]